MRKKETPSEMAARSILGGQWFWNRDYLLQVYEMHQSPYKIFRKAIRCKTIGQVNQEAEPFRPKVALLDRQCD